MGLTEIKKRILSLGLKPGGFKEYWGKEVQDILQKYEKTPKATDSEVLLTGLLKTSLDSLKACDPRIKFVPKFQVRIIDGYVAIKFDEEDLKVMEDHWNKFIR